MIKAILADDEPLVLIGLKSMINWKELGIHLCGTAANGDIAYELICEYHPEIVITDIQMPCSSGLALGKRCQDEFGRLPVFIILTNYEDFSYVKEAMHFQAIDYLIKIDLSPDSLISALKKAMEQVAFLKQQNSSAEDTRSSLLPFQERFYIRALNNLFESRKQFTQQAKEFHIPLQSAGYAAASLEQVPAPGIQSDHTLDHYHLAVHMFQELLSRYIVCHCIALDTRYLAVIFEIEKEHLTDWKSYIQEALTETLRMLNNYYNVTFYTSIGRFVTDAMDLCISYYDSKQLLEYLSDKNRLLFWNDDTDAHNLHSTFNLSLFRKEISQAFEELDEHALHETFDNVTSIITRNQLRLSQALDIASSILHLAIALLPNGTNAVSAIFQNEPDTYRSLYRKTTPAAIVTWLKILEDGLCETFHSSTQSCKNYLVSNCCQYVTEHLHEQIVLQDIADTFAVSSNYLSQTFKKHMGIGLIEYSNRQKIEEAKRLLQESTLKLYEISDMLGFNNSFYFSRVFKKVTGMTPKDYRNKT